MTSVSGLTAPAQRLSLRTLILTSTFALGANIVWLSYNIFILPVQVQAVTTEATKGIVLGALVGAAVGFAVIVNIVAGIISDHTNGRFGRRRPLLIWGTLLTLPFVLLSALFPLTLPLVAIQYLGMQVFTNVAAGAWQPTLADFVPEEQRGISAGIKGVFTLVGAAIGVGVITELFAVNLQTFAYILIVVLFALMALVNVVGMWRYDRPLPGAQPIKLWRAISETFRVEKRAGMSGFWWFVLGSFLIYMGVSGFQFFGVYYLEGILHITSANALDHAVQVTGLLTLVASVVFALVVGILSDKIGRRNIIIASALVAGAIGLFFPFARTFATFLVFSAFYGASNGVILSVDTALSSDLVPIEEAGKYMAYANLAVGVANGAAPPIFGLILNFQGAPTLTSFIVFFVVSAILFFASSGVMAFKVPNR